MHASKDLASVLGFCLALVLYLNTVTTESISEEEKCQRLLNDLRNTRISDRDCHFVRGSRGIEPWVSCTIYLSVYAPPDRNTEVDPEKENIDYGAHMDYSFKHVLGKPTNQTDDKHGGVLRCLYIKSVSFVRVEQDKRDRPKVFMASRIFSVVANAENISEAVDIMEPVAIGVASIRPECLDGTEKNTSSCLISIRVSTGGKSPGTHDDVHAGSVDFSITGFGYSHLTNIFRFTGTEDIQYIRTYPDRTRVGKGLLRFIPGINIISLLLSKNRWKALNDTIFPVVPKLEYLDLSGNAFEEFDSSLLNETILLKELNFSDSQLKKIPTFITKQSDLTLLNLGGNKFQYDVNSGASNLTDFIQHLTQIKKLNISGFITRHFSNSTLPKLPLLEDLDISKCDIYGMEEDTFRNQPALVRIDLSSNRLTIIPKRIFANLQHLRHVDFSSNFFTEGQGLVFYSHKDFPNIGMQTLDFSFNAMTATANLVAAKSQVRFISVRKNILKTVDGERLQNVKELDLSSNFIPALSSQSANFLYCVPTVNLSDNQFNCDSCDLPDFQYWLNHTGSEKLTEPVEDLLCAIPPSLRRDSITVINAEYNEEGCRGPNLPVILGSTFSSVALIVALLAGILYIYRFEASYVLHLIRVRRRAANDGGKPHSECIYDAFVSYSGRDRNWVLRILQPELEESDQKYQLCLHDRNFALGGIITQNIVDSIDKSRKTILILSENFVDSQWCRWEMEMANHKLFNDSRDFLVLIELDRLDRNNLPRHLRYLMDTRTYLEWPTESLAVVTSVQLETEKVSVATGPSEPALQVFWKRLRETLGDSLYTRQQVALKQAEMVVRQSQQRDPDGPVLRYRPLDNNRQEEAIIEEAL